MKILCLPRGQSWLPQLVSRLTSYTAKFDEPPPPECKVPRDGGLGVSWRKQSGQKEASLVFQSDLESRRGKKKLLLVVVKEMGLGVC